MKKITDGFVYFMDYYFADCVGGVVGIGILIFLKAVL